MDKLSGLGFDVDLPDGWDGRIYRRDAVDRAAASRALHAANFPLPSDRGDYGGGVHERMQADEILITLVEFEPGSANTALFSRQGPPRSVPADSFSPGAMPRAVPGKAGSQHFFSIGDRAFCLFVVIGSYSDRAELVARANAVVETLEIDA